MKPPREMEKPLIVVDLLACSALSRHAARFRYLCELINTISRAEVVVRVLFPKASPSLIDAFRERLTWLNDTQEAFAVLPHTGMPQHVERTLQQAFVASMKPALVLTPVLTAEADTEFALHIEVRALLAMDEAPLIAALVTAEVGFSCPDSSAERQVPLLVGDVFTNPAWSARERKTRRRRLGIYHPYLLCLHAKGHPASAFACLENYSVLPATARDQYAIVFMGCPHSDRTRLQQQASAMGIPSHRLHFVDVTDDRSLRDLYALCSAAIVASPSVEARLMAKEAAHCGAEVICLQDLQGQVSRLLQNTESDIDTEGAGSRPATPAPHSLLQEIIASLIAMAPPQAHDLIHQIQQKFANFCQRQWPQGVPDEYHDYVEDIQRRLSNSPRKPRLYVDLSELHRHDARTGIQRVTRSILGELLRHPPPTHEVMPVYASMDRTGYRQANQYLRNIWALPCKTENDADVFPVAGDTFLGLDLQPTVVVARKEDIHALRSAGVNVQFVIYDLLPVLLPDAFPAGTDRDHSAWLAVVAEADRVLCISRAVADEFYSWMLQESPHHRCTTDIRWFHLGADIENSQPSQGVPPDANGVLSALRDRLSFLVVGTLEPRKGLVQILDAFDLLWREGLAINLVFVGKPGWETQDLINRLLTHTALNERLFWFSGISDEYLEQIYANCSCMLTASRGEGFGLPLIEAARHKLPIIARDLPVFREVAGTHARYFSGSQPLDLARIIQQWISDHDAGTIPVSNGLPWLTWQQSAEQLKKAMFDPEYHKVADKQSHSRNIQMMRDDSLADLLDQVILQLNESNRRAQALEEQLLAGAQLREMDWKRQLTQMQDQIRQQDADLKNHQQLVFRQDADLQAKQSEVVRLQTLLNEKQLQLNQTQRQLEAAKTQEAHLHDVLESTSWKITKPLRTTVELARHYAEFPGRIKQRLGNRALSAFTILVRHPHVVRRISDLLARTPWLHRRASLVAQRLMARAERQKRSLNQPGSLTDTNLDPLGVSPETQEIYLRLKNAIQARKNK